MGEFTNIVTDELYESFHRGRKNPCGNWSFRDIWHGDNTKVFCELENHHDGTHMSLTGNCAWLGGIGGTLWFKDKTLEASHE